MFWKGGEGKMQRIALGFSGGMDSAFSALKLMELGYKVCAVYLKMCDVGSGKQDAERLADTLHIDFTAVDATSVFEKLVIKPFVRDYAEGRTPNPCIVCNPNVKFKLLSDFADLHGIEKIATGHYSVPCAVDGRYSFAPAADKLKDQGYFLYRLPQEIISRTVMPLGNTKKADVKAYFGDKLSIYFPKGESNDVCFSNGDYREIVKSYTKLPGKGDFVDEDGKVLGTHNGIYNYTVGQRKGLGVALGAPYFVKSIDPVGNSIVLAPIDNAVSSAFSVTAVNYLAKAAIKCGERYKVRVRYRAIPVICTVLDVTETRIKLEFDEPQKIVAPGQSAVFYNEDDIISFGGIICN